MKILSGKWRVLSDEERKTSKPKGKAAFAGPHVSRYPYSIRVTSFGDPRWHISI